jgi:hypothetical protein
VPRSSLGPATQVLRFPLCNSEGQKGIGDQGRACTSHFHEENLVVCDRRKGNGEGCDGGENSWQQSLRQIKASSWVHSWNLGTTPYGETGRVAGRGAAWVWWADAIRLNQSEARGLRAGEAMRRVAGTLMVTRGQSHPSLPLLLPFPLPTDHSAMSSCCRCCRHLTDVLAPRYRTRPALFAPERARSAADGDGGSAGRRVPQATASLCSAVQGQPPLHHCQAEGAAAPLHPLHACSCLLDGKGTGWGREARGSSIVGR